MIKHIKNVFSNLWGAFKEVCSYIKEPFLLSILFVDLLDLVLKIFSGDMVLVIIEFFFAMLIAKVLLGGSFK